MQSLFDLSEKVAIVTGGAKGIGKELCLGLARHGANVVVADIDSDGGRKTVSEIEASGTQGLFVETDVTNPDDIKRLVNQVLSNFGKIDILVNNAGVVVRKPVLETTDDDWDRVMRINLKSQFMCAKAVGPSMIERRRGKIINIGSICSVLGHPNRVAYATSKGGVALLTKVLAVEWGVYNINVNAIAPGYIRTPMTADYLADKANYDEVVSRIPMGRVGVTTDLVGPLVFLASDASNYVSGHVLLVDGARTAF